MIDTNLIKKIEERYTKRKKAKRKYDNAVSLSSKKEGEEKTFKLAASTKGQSVRLLDEGVVLYGDGEPWFYIMKGSLKSYYDSLSDDYVGSINLGHMDFASFPYLIGKWTKKDLTLVDIGDGRMGLDVKLNLDEESLFVKELRRKDYSVGVSAEFSYTVDWESSDLLRLEVLDSININDFAIVGEAGNVNSGGIFLKMEGEETKMEGETKMETLMEKWAKKLGLGQKEKVDTPPAEPNTPPTEPAAKPEGQLAGKDSKESEGKKSEKELDGQQLTEVLSLMEEMAAQNDQMVEIMEAMDKELEENKAELAAVKAERDNSNKQLSAEEKTVNDALAKFKTLAAKYGADQKKAAAEKKDQQDKGKDGQDEEYKLSAELSNDGLGEL